jgi:hypothetical protein
MTRSHVLLHCPGQRLVAARVEAGTLAVSAAVVQSEMGEATCEVSGVIRSEKDDGR